jgi:uncharacterized membrane protein
MGQVRCPNCGGYKAVSEAASFSLLWIFLIIMYLAVGLATYGIGCIIGLPILFFLKKYRDRGIKSEFYTCEICGYHWKP